MISAIFSEKSYHGNFPKMKATNYKRRIWQKSREVEKLMEVKKRKLHGGIGFAMSS